MAQITNQYWIEKYRKQDFQAFGTEGDKQARISDYLGTEVSWLCREATHTCF